MKASIENKVLIGFLASMLVLAGIGWGAYRTTDQLVTTENWVSHTHQVISVLERGLAILTDAESKQRGFLITGDKKFLDDYREAETKVASWMGELQGLIRDNPQQLENLDKLKALIFQRLALLNGHIEKWQQEGNDAAATSVEIDSGKAVMDKIRANIADMKDMEEQLLVERQQAAQIAASINLFYIMAGGVLAGGIGLMALFFIRRDLQRRWQAELAVEESRRVMQSILDNIPGIVFMKDLKGRYLFVNRMFEHVAGKSRTEIEGKTVFDLAPKDLAEKSEAHQKTILATQAPLEVEETVLYPDGPRPHLAVKFPLRDANGRVYATGGISTDITEKKKVEQLHLHFRALFESLPGLYLVLKPDLTIVAVSDAFLQATMTRREAILGQGIFDAFPDNPNDATADGVANLRASLEGVLKNGITDTMAIQRYDMRKPDGVFEKRYWSPINSPVIGLDGRIEYIIHRVEDVTDFMEEKKRPAGGQEMSVRLEQMEAEIYRSAQEAKSANEKLRDANQELEAFSYSVSHDLRAPLRHIAGFVDLLQKNAGPALVERDHRFLKIISDSANRMGTLIDDLLVFSRMSRMELRRVKVASTTLLDEARNTFQSEMNGRQIEWKVGPLPEVEADVPMLRQVWVNLIGNAIKYSRTRDPAQIEVGCEDTGNGEWVFHVRDNGVGFDMKYVDKLFGVFQRLHRADEFEGTGIGLANVRRIVTRHGGRTWAEGTLGTGAIFFFSLPKTNHQPIAQKA